MIWTVIIVVGALVLIGMTPFIMRDLYRWWNDTQYDYLYKGDDD
jgi:hypothetical protein